MRWWVHMQTGGLEEVLRPKTMIWLLHAKTESTL